MPRCTLTIIDECGDVPLDRPRIHAAVEAALAGDDLAGCALTVLLVGDDENARLHQEHFGNPEPTDVMTFPDGTVDPESGLTLLGDLAVGHEVARRTAADLGRRVEDEVTLYIVHGLLHLLGYDDHDEGDRRAMWQRQVEILEPLGIDIGDADA